MNIYFIYPMFVMVLLTALVLMTMFMSRISAVRSGKMSVRYFKTFNFGEPTEAVVKTSRHFVNLFELPVLFYVGCVVAMVLPMNDRWSLIWAWFFVIARIFHAYIHLGSNKIPPRMIAYGLSWLAVLALWIDIVSAVTVNLK